MWKIVILYLVALCFVLQCQIKGFVEGVSFEEDVRISFEQKMAIDKLRRRVLPRITEDFMKSDIYLVKRLRAVDFDISLAEKKLIENLEWRKENKLATIDKEDFSDVAQDYPYADDGVDKEGRPVFIGFIGDWDIRSAVVTGRAKRVLRYLDQGLENLAKRVRVLQLEGKNVTQAILIMELSQFSLVQHACIQCLRVVVDFLNRYETHYPGMADKVIFVDAPPAVQFVIEIVKQSVSKESRAAITTYGTNKAQWKQVLQKYIDRKYLPVELGGTAERA